MPDDVKTGTDNNVTLDESGFIPGTQYKSVADLIKGHSELKGKLDAQGNELGELRKSHGQISSQAETLATVLKEHLTKGTQSPSPAPGTDYGKEIADVQTQIKSLDPMAADYQKTLGDLVAKSNNLVAAQQHEKTLNAAGKMFKEELSERDVKAAQQRFYDENPTFNTPEMQAKIKEYIAKDRTGMSDPLVAFREIQRDDVAAKAAALAKENEEYKKLIELNKGKDDAGHVIVKGQSGVPPTKPSKVTGKDLDAGMAEALKKSRSET